MADELTEQITRAVKAELARRDIDGVALVPVLGIGRNAVYARLRYERPFDTAELEKIATFLGMTLGDLIASAEFGQRFASRRAAAA